MRSKRLVSLRFSLKSSSKLVVIAEVEAVVSGAAKPGNAKVYFGADFGAQVYTERYSVGTTPTTLSFSEALPAREAHRGRHTLVLTAFARSPGGGTIHYSHPQITVIAVPSLH